MPRLLSKKMAVGAYVIWRCLESRTKSRERDLNFRHEKNQNLLIFFIIRTFEKSEPLTNIPLCAKNCIFKGSDFILGVLCFVKKRRRVIKYG